MMNNWKKYKLGEVVSWGNGKERPKDKGPIPVYGGNGVLDYTNQNNYEGETVIVGRVGAYCGSVYYTNESIWVSDNALAAKPKNGNDTKFLYYFLQYLNLNSYAEGSTHPLVTQRLLNSIDAVIPPLDEQKRIAGVLSSLDDKIDLLHRENATLEALAETLFRHYFIEKPDPIWKEGKLGDILSVKGGTTPSTNEPKYWNGNIAWTSPRDVTTLNGMYLFKTERTITEEGLAKISSGLLPAGTLLMSSRAPVGVLAFAEIPVAINQGYIAIIDDKGYPKEFIYLWLKENMEAVHSYSNGSTFMEISKTAFKSLDITIPDIETVSRFTVQVKPLFEKIKFNQQQILTLAVQRDTLLPRLMSDEVKVVDF